MPRRRRNRRISARPSRETSIPPTRSVPADGRSVRLSTRKSVVFPAPLAPMNAIASPRPMTRATFSSVICRCVKTFATPTSSYIVSCIRLFQEPARECRFLDRAPVLVTGPHITPRPMQVEQPPVLRVLIAKAKERACDLLADSRAEVRPDGPRVVDVRRRRPEDAHLISIDPAGLH